MVLGLPLLDGVVHAAEVVKFGASAVGLFDISTTVQLKPEALERAGRLADQLRKSGFEESKVRQIIRALFTTHLLKAREAEQQMERAFDVWDEAPWCSRDCCNIPRHKCTVAGDLEPVRSAT